MPNEIKIEKSIYQKLQQDIRVPISKLPLKKSGKNTHLGYAYFTLEDFLPTATELIANAGLCTIFSINFDQSGVEMATLTLTNGTERIQFVIPTASVPRQEGIFETGSKNTYCKRYLYMNLLELTEPDVAEITNQNAEPENDDKVVPKEERKATAKQVDMLRKLYSPENILAIIQHFNVDSLEELTMTQASGLISKKRPQ